MVDHADRWEHLEEAIDELRVRFGRHVVEPARLRPLDSDHAARDA
jgi:hypothetical protein